METQDSRNIRADGSQLAFAMVLRELAVAVFPSDAERAIRCDLLCEQIEALYAREDLTLHAHDPLQIALSAVEAIFAPATSPQPPSPER